MQVPLRPAPATRLELGALDLRLTRADAGVRASLALAAAYGGEATIVLGFGGVRNVREGAVSKLVGAAAWLLEPWGREGRIELRSLRPPVRRTLLLWLAERDELAVLAAARRGIVVAPAPDTLLRREAERSGLGGTRRKMLLLAARDGDHCVWCRKPLTFRSPEATVDHVRCRSRGGGNALENLVLACARCNHARSDTEAELWFARRLASGEPVDEEAVAAAIRRSLRHHRRATRRATRLAEAA